jgi:hypothetical protein
MMRAASIGTLRRLAFRHVVQLSDAPDERCHNVGDGEFERRLHDLVLLMPIIIDTSHPFLMSISPF